MRSTRSQRSWIIVSKPLREPFRDGTTVLARHLIEHLPAPPRLSYFGDPARPIRAASGDRVLAAPPMPLAPRLRDKLRVLAALFHPGHLGVPLHFMFTPNRVTSTALSLVRRVPPQRPVVQDVTSSHGADRFVNLLRPLDAVIVHSEHTRGRLVGAGLPDSRVHRIYPGVPGTDATGSPHEHRRVLYAGDLDAAVVERLIAVAGALSEPALDGWTLCVAARAKSGEDATLRSRLAEGLNGRLPERFELLGDVEDMDGLLRRCSLQLFVADHVRRKVDLPFVLLEGLARGVPLIALDVAPVNEIFERGAALDRCPGRAVAAADLPGSVAAAAAAPELLAQWSRAARDLVAQEFSAERMSREYAGLYERLDLEDVDH